MKDGLYYKLNSNKTKRYLLRLTGDKLTTIKSYDPTYPWGAGTYVYVRDVTWNKQFVPAKNINEFI